VKHLDKEGLPDDVVEVDNMAGPSEAFTSGISQGLIHVLPDVSGQPSFVAPCCARRALILRAGAGHNRGQT
jgi:hypothetical protein